jgi:hypothetical protein
MSASFADCSKHQTHRDQTHTHTDTSFVCLTFHCAIHRNMQTQVFSTFQHAWAARAAKGWRKGAHGQTPQNQSDSKDAKRETKVTPKDVTLKAPSTCISTPGGWEGGRLGGWEGGRVAPGWEGETLYLVQKQDIASCGFCQYLGNLAVIKAGWTCCQGWVNLLVVSGGTSRGHNIPLLFQK